MWSMVMTELAATAAWCVNHRSGWWIEDRARSERCGESGQDEAKLWKRHGRTKLDRERGDIVWDGDGDGERRGGRRGRGRKKGMGWDGESEGEGSARRVCWFHCGFSSSRVCGLRSVRDADGERMRWERRGVRGCHVRGRTCNLHTQHR